ncbi:unnamed protein product [Microthlaspi erraticum]|uniref:RNase H type-1 domain-containing protein n=1 Tax=Microthlaspi erraticum TaxID=1685480 RepID=A0A6D2KID4_9BRAS|nr:unnamed protein product [Microthlaspi erraticum]
MFAMAVWWGWKWRCGNIFGENRKCRDRMRFLKEIAKDVFSVTEACAAAAGGVLRNHLGDWCGGFALHIGRCTAPLAELWGVYYGLCIAWDRRIPKLEVEVDSELVVEFLTTGIGVCLSWYSCAMALLKGIGRSEYRMCIERLIV